MHQRCCRCQICGSASPAWGVHRNGRRPSPAADWGRRAIFEAVKIKPEGSGIAPNCANQFNLLKSTSKYQKHRYVHFFPFELRSLPAVLSSSLENNAFPLPLAFPVSLCIHSGLAQTLNFVSISDLVRMWRQKQPYSSEPCQEGLRCTQEILRAPVRFFPLRVKSWTPRPCTLFSQKWQKVEIIFELIWRWRWMALLAVPWLCASRSFQKVECWIKNPQAHRTERKFFLWSMAKFLCARCSPPIAVQQVHPWRRISWLGTGIVVPQLWAFSKTPSWSV